MMAYHSVCALISILDTLGLLHRVLSNDLDPNTLLLVVFKR